MPATLADRRMPTPRGALHVKVEGLRNGFARDPSKDAHPEKLRAVRPASKSQVLEAKLDAKFGEASGRPTSKSQVLEAKLDAKFGWASGQPIPRRS